MAIFAADAALWWAGGIIATIVLLVLSAILVPGMFWGEKTQVKQESRTQSKASSVSPERKARKKRNDVPGRIEDEPWFPEIEFKTWQEANQLPGCPWSFDGCDCVEDVIKSIWRTPLHTGLQQALSALTSRVKSVRVARVHYRMPDDETFFAVVYSLKSGAELFGGQPLDMSVGLDLEGICEPGIRRRHGSAGSPQSRGKPADSLENGLPCLAPFYRIHDGFGCLLSSKHLAVLLANPGDSIQGSCFYVYPTRCLEPLRSDPYLVRFARVDKDCAAVADIREELPHVVFAETNGVITQDDEPPLDFVADTICNVAGQKVVPDHMSYQSYHAYSSDAMPTF